eukprot:363445-Chlamydomonas_euryale.AAC.2
MRPSCLVACKFQDSEVMKHIRIHVAPLNGPMHSASTPSPRTTKQCRPARQPRRRSAATRRGCVRAWLHGPAGV